MAEQGGRENETFLLPILIIRAFVTIPGGFSTVTNEEIVEKIQSGEDPQKYMAILWEKDKRFVKFVIRKSFGLQYSKDEYLQQELEQEGFIALISAAREYDPGHEVTFLTFAFQVIKNHLSRYVDECCSIVRIPASMKERIYKYENYIKQYTAAHGLFPDDETLMKDLDLSPEQLDRVRKTVHSMNIRSLDEHINAEEDSTVVMDLIDAGIDIEDLICRQVWLEELHKDLEQALSILPCKAQAYIRAAYYHNMSCRKIGELFGCSHQYVNNTIKKSFWQIVHSRHRKALLEFMPEGFIVPEGLYSVYVDIELFEKQEQENEFLL